jgi:predicted permease
MHKFILTLLLILTSLFSGYTFQKLVERGKLRPKLELTALSKFLQKTALLVINPVVFLGAVWIVDIDNIRYIALPFLGISALFLGGLLAFLFSRILHLDRTQTGVYIISGGFTNIGAMGGLVTFLFLGEIGFALVPIYKIFEEFSYYAFGFPLAKSFSRDFKQSGSLLERLTVIVTDKFVIVAVSSIAAGFILNGTGVPRPEFYASLNEVLIPVLSVVLIFSIGLVIRFSSVKTYLKPSAIIAAIKSLIVPAAVATVAYCIGLGEIADGLPLKVVIILAAMPVGFISLVPPALYNLDTHLANSNWIVSNMVTLGCIPLLYFVVTMI